MALSIRLIGDAYCGVRLLTRRKIIGSTAGVTSKCLPMKNPPGERYSRIWYVFSLLEYRRPHKNSTNYRIVPPRQVSPADNLPV